MKIKDFFTNSFNVEFHGVRIEDVAEKIGSVFGDKGREIGRRIDGITKDITIKLDKDKDE